MSNTVKQTIRFFSTAIVLLVIAGIFQTTAQSQLLFEENFSYTSGTNVTANGWTAHSGTGTNPQKIAISGLVYSGYPSSSIGNADSVATTGEDVNKTWASSPSGVVTGNLYFSFLVNLTYAQISSNNGDYFIHFYKNSSAFTARVYAKRKSSDPSKFSFGIAKSSTAANIAYSDSIYSIGTTYLIAVKYIFVANAGNDSVQLFINPVPGASEPTPTIKNSTTDIASTDMDTVYGVAIRQGGSTTGPAGLIDGIRVGTTWSAILPSTSSSSSDVISAGNETANIDYASFQSNAISSITDGVRLWSFIIRDGGGSADADTDPTILSSITMSKGASNTVSNWANSIRRAALFNGANLISDIAVNGETISFSGLSGANVTATDDGNTTIDLYVTFETTVTDNQQFHFQVTNSTVTAGTSSSTFTAFTAISDATSDANKIEVTATKISFTTQPSASVGVFTDFSSAVSAQDI
ncbi:MAG: hypothetical protein FJ218_08755, partial [Ignavibacteria bacterium]|nr:hypothetical protein [Ignavibacteria bacterium]